MIAQGISKQVRVKKETTFGTPAGATGGKLLRRVTSEINLEKETYQSAEIRTDYQIADFRHGVRSVTGTLNGELSPNSYSEFFAAVLAKDFAAGGTTTAITNVTASATAPHFVRGSGSFITDGFKVGDIVRWTGFGVANNNKNFLITALTDTAMTVVAIDGSAVVGRAAGDSVTCSVVGKKTYTPTTGHTADSFTIEEWHSDISKSRLFTGCKINNVAVSIPATGIATSNFGIIGKDLAQTASTEYFTSPTALATTGVTAGVNGLLVVDGVAVAVVTSADFTIDRGISGEAVVGSNVKPFLFEGRVNVTGNMSVYFEDLTYFNKFANETETAVTLILTTSNAANADFISFTFPRVKFGSATLNDGETGLIQTMSFTALFPASSTGYNQSTLIVQDSTL